MIKQRLHSLATGAQATRGAVLIVCALLLSGLAAAQNAPTPGTDSDDDQTVPVPAKTAPAQPAPPPAKPGPKITIRILDSKTGAPIRPSNFMIRIDHKDEPYNEELKLNDDYTATAVLPPGATLLSVQGAYESSMEVYINCDTDIGKDGGTLKWYSVADIVKTGIVTSNLCYRGKYEHKLNVSAVPGEFVFFVRTHNWRDGLTD
jgi:hypothetical protein